MEKADIASAFDHPYARSVAMGNAPLDRISVRDYVREVEIGAFTSERGVTQRIRFNAVVEITRHTAAQDDDVDKVVSYDSITEAIEALIAAGRINLLETFAERIAEMVLEDPRVVRIFLRVEKLDRIPGALGVEIVRTRLEHGPDIRPVVPEVTTTRRPDPLLLYLDDSILKSSDIGQWIEAASALEAPVILCLPPFAKFASGSVAKRVALLSFDQMAWQIAALDDRLSVIATRTELDHAIKSPGLVIWAPSKMVAESTDLPELDRLASWLRQCLGASRFVAAGAHGIGETSQAATPEDLKGA